MTPGFSGGSDGKESACNAGDSGTIPGSGRSPGEGNGNPLQHSCLENPRDRRAWRATVYGIAKSQTRLSDSFVATLVTAGVCIPVMRMGSCEPSCLPILDPREESIPQLV